MGKKTIFDKIWDKHLVHEEEGRPTLLYIDLHLIHEVTSPQAFEGLRESKRMVRFGFLMEELLDSQSQ